MQFWIRMLGGAAAIVLIGVSASTNARFGYGLGEGQLEGSIFAVGSIALDIFKVASVFFFMWALASRQYLAGVAGVMVFSLCTAYSLTSAIGFAAENREGKTASLDVPKRQREGLVRRLGDARQRLETLGTARASGEISGELAAHKRSVRWKNTSECTDVTVGRSRVYCAKHDRLKGELSRSKAREEVLVAIENLEDKLGSLNSKPILEIVDPQARVLTGMFGWGASTARMVLSVLMACVIELVSAVGLYLAVQSGRSEAKKEKPKLPQRRVSKAKQRMASIVEFTLGALERREGGRVSLDLLISRFEQWCRDQGRVAGKRDGIRRDFVVMLKDADVQLHKEGKATFLIGVGLGDMTS